MHYTFKSTPTISIKGRHQTIIKPNHPSSIPSSTHYQAKKPLKKSSSIAIAKQKREIFKVTNQAPGPGFYQSKSFINEGPKRSMSARLISQPKKTPGPLDYNANSLVIKNKSPSFSLGIRSKSIQKILEQKNLDKPGPGYYSQNSTFDLKKGFALGNSQRKQLSETQKTPAPTHYSPEKCQYNSTKNPRCSIGGQKRQLKIQQFQSTPGPLAYETKSFLDNNKKKGFTCGQRLKDLIAEQLASYPASNQYNKDQLKFKLAAPRCPTSQAKRKTFIDQAKKTQQGKPSHFTDSNAFMKSSKFRASSASIFGRSKRKDLDDNEKTPGPLAYDADKIKLLKQSGTFSPSKATRKSDFLNVMDPENPGPGNYNSNVNLIKESSRKVIMTRQNRPNFDKEKDKPSPGQYNINSKPQGPIFSITKQKRKTFVDMVQKKQTQFHDKRSEVANPTSSIRVESKTKFSPSKMPTASSRF